MKQATFPRPNRWIATLAIFGALAFVPFAVATAPLDDASRNRLSADIRYLASDELEGRGIGTKGLDLAAEFMASEFKKIGLKPVMPDGSYFQPFETPGDSTLGETNNLTCTGPGGESIEAKLGETFTPLVFSGSGKFSGSVVFAGYGITASEYGYDDYAGHDVKGKVVLVLRREPRQVETQDPHAPFGGTIDTQHASLSQKATNAAKRGAAALLYVTDAASLKTGPDKLIEFGYASGTPTHKIPLLHITRALADQMLKASIKQDLKSLETAIDSDLKPRTTALEGWQCSGEVTIKQEMIAVKNVLGVLPGEGPQANETIVIGAHYDHLGYGGEGSLAPGSREIHNGADDNASGTAAVLELARRLAKRDKPLDRQVLFMGFTAEERGLFGSRHYVDQPALPIEKTVAMINLDMIGRLRNNKLIVEGVGTAKEFKPMLESLNAQRGFDLRPMMGGMGPSDHTSFYSKRIPVLFFWTDYHPDYHRPSDDTELVSVEGLERVISLVEQVTIELAQADERPAFVETPAPAAPTASTNPRPYLGSIPAFGVTSEGAALDGVAPGGPADKAGIRGGDVIVQIGAMEIRGLQDMENALRMHKPGDVVKITVRRAGLRITLPVTLGRRPQ